jgi:hypothetical protein
MSQDNQQEKPAPQPQPVPIKPAEPTWSERGAPRPDKRGLAIPNTVK